MAKSEALVRVGIVSAVNYEQKQAQVYYPDMSDMVSDWLPVTQHKEDWMPGVNARVLVVYLFGWNTDGFILGVIP